MKQVIKHLRCHPLTSERAGNGRLSTSKSAKESRSITFKVIFGMPRALRRGGSRESAAMETKKVATKIRAGLKLKMEGAWRKRGLDMNVEEESRACKRKNWKRLHLRIICEKFGIYKSCHSVKSDVSLSRRFSAWLRTISDARSIALASMTEVAAI